MIWMLHSERMRLHLQLFRPEILTTHLMIRNSYVHYVLNVLLALFFFVLATSALQSAVLHPHPCCTSLELRMAKVGLHGSRLET